MKELKLVFENCERMTVNCEVESYVVLDSNKIDNIIIKIPIEENTAYYPFNSTIDETTKFKRIRMYNDISCVIIDDKNYDVMWYGDGDINNNQKSYKDECGNLIIEINSTKAKQERERNTLIKLIDTYWKENRDLTFNEILNDIDTYIKSNNADTNRKAIRVLLDKIKDTDLVEQTEYELEFDK